VAGLPRAIIDLEDFNESVNIMIYGNSGVGKTVLAGTTPNALIIAAERGTISAKRVAQSGAKVWPCPNWAEFEAAYDWVEQNPGVFDWVWIDSATKIQSHCIRHILDEAVANNSSRDVDIPAIQDHYKWQLMMKRFVVMWNDLPVNVGWTAQAMHKSDEEGDDIVLPLILGKDYDISATICGEMDVLGYLSVDKVKRRVNGEVKTSDVRRLLVHSRAPYFAKDRYHAIADPKGNGYMVDPTMPKIIERIGAPAPRSGVGSSPRRSTGTAAKSPAKASATARKASTTRRAPARRPSK